MVLLFLGIIYFSFIYGYVQVPVYPIRSPTKHLFVCLFIHYAFIYPFNHPSYQLSIHASVYLSIRQPSINPWIYTSTHILSLRVFIHPFIYHPPTYSSSCLPTYPSIHVSFYSFIPLQHNKKYVWSLFPGSWHRALKILIISWAMGVIELSFTEVPNPLEFAEWNDYCLF